MNWLKRVAQSYSVEEIIMGVQGPSPRFDISWAAQYLVGTYGATTEFANVCETIEAATKMAANDNAVFSQMRRLSVEAGCPNFDPELSGQPDELAQPEVGAIPELGAQEKPMNMPSVEIA